MIELLKNMKKRNVEMIRDEVRLLGVLSVLWKLLQRTFEKNQALINIHKLNSYLQTFNEKNKIFKNIFPNSISLFV